MKGINLADGRQVGLADWHNDKLQNYLGLAMRRNVGNVEDMQRDACTIYFHKLSTDSDPQYGLCPQGEESWCKFNKAICKGEIYKHKSSLPEEVLKSIKTIFKDLSDKNCVTNALMAVLKP